MALLLISGILGLFVDKMTADDKYSLPNREKLWQPIQMQLCQKQKYFPQPFAALLRTTSNFQHVQKKDDPHSWCIFEIRDCEKRG